MSFVKFLQTERLGLFPKEMPKFPQTQKINQPHQQKTREKKPTQLVPPKSAAKTNMYTTLIGVIW